MGRIISVHEYELKPGVEASAFEEAVKNARDRGLLRLPGLISFYFLRGVRGIRNGKYAAVWIYESKEDWKKLWGPVERPIGREDYPRDWRVWEDEVLAPFLVSDPDAIHFTSYEVF